MDRIDSLRSVVGEVYRAHPFEIIAWVVLPEHLHAIWRMPDGDTDYPMRWGLIKAGFSRALPKVEKIGQSRTKKGERGIWQRRYWEHMIRDDLDLERHVDYIHYNPVKHGCVRRAMDWEFSTFHRYVRAGWIPENWGGETIPDTVGRGELANPNMGIENIGPSGFVLGFVPHPNLPGLPLSTE